MKKKSTEAATGGVLKNGESSTGIFLENLRNFSKHLRTTASKCMELQILLWLFFQPLRVFFDRIYEIISEK